MKRNNLVLGLLVLAVGLVLLETEISWANADTGYKVVMSKQDRLCTHIREVLNEDLAQYGPRYDPRKFSAPVFSAIAWTPVGLDEGFDYGGDVAHFDINNDGTTEVVVRQETTTGRDISVKRLFVFKEDQYPELAKKRRELEDNVVGSVDLFKGYDFRGLPHKTFKEPGVLKGKTYYDGLSAAAYIHPFVFQNKTYLLLTRSPDSLFLENWALVAKYKRGKVHEADPLLMEDVCYLRSK